MSAKRYYVRSIRGRDNQILWRVYDTQNNGSTAKGTKGAGGRPGGYASEADANAVRDRLNQES